MPVIDLIEFAKIIILSIIQGITEWLPISSTGHLILVEDLLQLQLDPNFMEMFRTVVQFGSILAVVLLYFNRLNPLNPRKNQQEKKDTWILWSKVIIATIPAGVLGLLIKEYMEEYGHTP